MRQVAVAVAALTISLGVQAGGTLVGNAQGVLANAGADLILLPDGDVISAAEVRVAALVQGGGPNDVLVYDVATGRASIREGVAVSTLLLDEPVARVVIDEPNFQALNDPVLADRNRVGRFSDAQRAFFPAYPGTQYGATVLDQSSALTWVGSFATAYTGLLPPGNPFQPDSDGDRVPDVIDNCTFEPNGTQQLDTNGDGFGNRCDADLNNDCVVNAIDLGLLRTEFFSTGALDQDFSGDGVVNAVDLGILRTQFFGMPGPSALADCSFSGLP